VQQSLADKTVREKLAAQGAEVLSATPSQFAAILKDDIVKWEKIVKASGAKVD
jgi:tripartite-type tricarboxylate transporter receptor subunit TctC